PRGADRDRLGSNLLSGSCAGVAANSAQRRQRSTIYASPNDRREGVLADCASSYLGRSEEHTSELQSRFDLVCRLLLEKKNIIILERRSVEVLRTATRTVRTATVSEVDACGLVDELNLLICQNVSI